MIQLRSSHSKIEQEKRRLASLQAFLTRANALTSGMVSTLNHFEEKLQTIDELITPVHQAAKELDLLTTRVDESLIFVDSVLHYYDVFNQLAPIISSGPGVNLSDYLAELNRLEDAVRYFNGITAVEERKRVVQLYEKGQKLLVEESDKLINRYANPLSANELIELCKSTSQTPSHTQEEDMVLLQKIVAWLGDHGFRQGLIDSYTLKKGMMIRRSLQLLDEHLNRNLVRRSSTNTLNVTPQTSMTLSRSETMKRPVKTSGELKYSISRVTKTPVTPRVTSLIEDSMPMNLTPELSLQRQTINYEKLLDAFAVLLQREDEILNRIFQREFHANIFNKFIEMPLIYMKEKGEKLCQTIENLRHKLDPAQSAIDGLIDILKWFMASLKKYPRLHQDQDKNRRTQLTTISMIFQKSVINCFQAVLEEIRLDTSSISEGGNVHSLTSHVFTFIDELLKSEDVVTRIASLYVQEKTTMNQNKFSGKEKGLHDLGVYFTQLINTLFENLSKKNDAQTSRQDSVLRSIFLLNNINYLLKRLENSTLSSIIQLYDSNLKSKYQNDFQTHLKDYTKCYSPLILAIQQMFEYDNNHHIPEAKLRDKDREKLKETFSQINTTIDSIKEQCEGYIVSDVNLRQRLREESKTLMNDMFKKFYEKFARKDFTKHREKYVRYDPRIFETSIENFF